MKGSITNENIRGKSQVRVTPIEDTIGENHPTL